jgi:hypothetical protein
MTARQMIEIYLKSTLEEKNVDTILKLEYKGGRGHFKIDLLAVEKAADFSKILDFIGDSNIFVFDSDKKIEQLNTYLFEVVEILKDYRNKNKGFTDDDSKKAVIESNTLLKRFIGFNARLKKRFPFYDIPDITDDESTTKTKKLSYYISIFVSEKCEQTVKLVDGFSFYAKGYFCGVHKCENGYYNSTLLCCGIAITKNQKSKKAAIAETLRILESCNLSQGTIEEGVKHFRILAERVNADLSYLPAGPETAVTPVEPPTEPETVATPTEPPTEPETVVTPRRAYYFTPVSPGERHAAAITPENAAPPMVVIWLYFAILQKRLFEVSHTFERCHVPVYGFTRVLYTVVTLLLYRVSLSGLLPDLPLFVVSNFKRDHGDTFPCTLYGFTALRVLCEIETGSGLTRLTGCRTCYHDTS